MQVQTIKTTWAIGQLKQNTYIVSNDEGCILIDAGCSLEEVRAVCDKPIKAVFLTHGHFDHVLKIEEYDKFGIPLYANEKTQNFFKDYNLNASFVPECVFSVGNIVPVKDGDEIEVLGMKIKCFETPGHSADSMCFLIKNTLFSGDTVFSVAVGRTDLLSGNIDEQIKSLTKVKELEYETLFSGHGRASTKEEQNTNIDKWINILKEMKGNKRTI